jgi:phosphatidate cytidylyltransferase
MISGVILVAVFGLTAFGTSPLSSILFMLISVPVLFLAQIEFFYLTKQLSFPGYPFLTATLGVVQLIALGLAHHTLNFLNFEQLFLFTYIVSVFVCAYRDQNMADAVPNLLISFGGFLYLSWSLLFMAKIYFAFDLPVTDGKVLFLFLILVTKSGDIGGYVAGKITGATAVGNHKMVPRLSPKKSWEGLVGGFILSIAVALLMVHFIGDKIVFDLQPNLNYVYAILIAILLTIFGLIGDLSVSLLKRAAQQKDSGTMIPGFGGILDVVDSLIFVSPFFYYFLKVISLSSHQVVG